MRLYPLGCFEGAALRELLSSDILFRKSELLGLPKQQVQVPMRLEPDRKVRYHLHDEEHQPHKTLTRP